MNVKEDHQLTVVLPIALLSRRRASGGNVQAQRKAAYQEKTGRPMPRDNLVLGSAYRQAGIFAAYDPMRPEDGEDDDRGLGAWQDRKNWHTVSQSMQVSPAKC